MMKRIVGITLAMMMVFLILPKRAGAEPEGTQPGASTAKAYILIEANTRQVIAGERADEQLPVAGLAKLMSYLLFYEALADGKVKATDMVPVSQEAAKKTGTRVFLDSGTQYSFETLLKPAIMCSANDAVCALAEHIFGNEQAFTDAMNARAKELGLGCTFADSTGISAETRMSAQDLATIAAELSKYPAFFQYSSVWLDTFVHESGRETEMTNSNKLIKSEGFDGMATGSTADSGYSLVASLKNGGARYLCVVIGDTKSDQRFEFARQELNYASATFAVKQIAQRDGKVKSVPVTGGNVEEVELYAAEDLALLFQKGEEPGVEKKIEVQELVAPLKKGQIVGKISVTTGSGKEVSVALCVARDVEQLTYGSTIQRILSNWLFRSDKIPQIANN